jgi:hypothetical protein
MSTILKWPQEFLIIEILMIATSGISSQHWEIKLSLLLIHPTLSILLISYLLVHSIYHRQEMLFYIMLLIESRQIKGLTKLQKIFASLIFRQKAHPYLIFQLRTREVKRGSSILIGRLI